MAGKKKEEKEKPLEKMTATELREVAKTIPEITGVHGMNKAELIYAIKDARGIKDETKKSTSRDVRAIKTKMREFKDARAKALASDDSRMAAIYRRKISRLKKQTRRAA